MRTSRRLTLCMVFLCVLISCQQPASKVTNEAGLTHCVFLNLHDASSSVMVEEKLLQLASIPQVQTISVVTRTDVGDARALDYDLVLMATFVDKEALKAYDQNAFHQQIRQELKPFLAGPPATFDYTHK